MTFRTDTSAHATPRRNAHRLQDPSHVMLLHNVTQRCRHCEANAAMSFNFEWPVFSDEFHENAARTVKTALNRGPKPKVIAGEIDVHELNMGTEPPELEILEIGDLSRERFRGIFRLMYSGDAHIVLSTTVQANPLATQDKDDAGLFASPTASRRMLFAASPLSVPMRLRLSQVRLRAIVVLVVSRSKGVTLVFKNDPLESVQVSSTFDSIGVIQKYLQAEIEVLLREMFREDLPAIIHQLSQQWLRNDLPRPSDKRSGPARDAAAGSARKLPEPRLHPHPYVSAQYSDEDAMDIPLSLLAVDADRPPTIGISPGSCAGLARLNAQASPRGLKDLFSDAALTHSPQHSPVREQDDDAESASDVPMAHARTFHGTSRARAPRLQHSAQTPQTPRSVCSYTPPGQAVSAADIAGRLAELARSNHTLSPYTRQTERVAMRTAPGLWTSRAPQQTVRRPARQRRVFRLG